MAGGFGFPKYPQKKSPNPKMVGELLAHAGGHAPPTMGAVMPGEPGHPRNGGLRPSSSGLPTEPTAAFAQSPTLGLKK